jgi:hypothetical protein
VQLPALVDDLKSLVEPHTSGSPMQPLLWASRSLANLAGALKEKGHAVSTYVVRGLLKSQNYSLQANRKTHEGSDHPDRDSQFSYIAGQREKYLAEGDPVLSIDGKKKELIGDYKNNGREWRPKNAPEQVNVYDFVDPNVGRATPYGIYDITQNKGLVVLGFSFDTARLAVNALRLWWINIGKAVYARATGILITADGGGSNGSRVRLSKIELQILANECGLPITVCHYPPGTSKWNPTEHKMFSYISNQLERQTVAYSRSRGELYTRHDHAIGSRDRRPNRPDDLRKRNKNIRRGTARGQHAKHAFHGEWNYTIFPQPPPYFWKHRPGADSRFNAPAATGNWAPLFPHASLEAAARSTSPRGDRAKRMGVGPHERRRP